MLAGSEGRNFWALSTKIEDHEPSLLVGGSDGL